jgi:hypothetical protein
MIRTPASADQASFISGGDGGGAVADAELGVDVQQVGLDGGLADQELARRDLVGGAVGDELETSISRGLRFSWPR